MKYLLSIFLCFTVPLVLAACAAASGVSAPAAETVTTTPTAEPEVNSGSTRSIVHAMGETEVPANPQRVVVLDTGELDNTLALGVKPVGGPVADAQEYQGYLAGQLDGIAETGGVSEPNLEAILALKPDLILGSKQRHEAIYEQLAQIAPTVFVESLRVPWQDNFRLQAEALGKTAAAEQLLAEYEAHVAEVQTVLGDKLTNTTVSIIRFRPGQVRLYLKSSYIGYILQDVGLQRPASQDQDVFSAEISLEQIADVDADYIFVTGYDQEDSELDTFLESSLWQTLRAVQNERVIDVNDDTWIAGLGVQAANHVLDDLITYFQDTASAASENEAAFPVTIEHKYGRTEITERPERIVTVGLTDHDALLALGVVPVGTTEWFGEYPGAIWPWAQDKLGGVTPELVGDAGAINFEKIAVLKPDVILALYSGVTQEQYDLLSQIAPTVAQPAEYVDYGIPWQELTHKIGQAVGQTEKADALVAEVEARFADVQAEHPEFVDASAVVATPYEGIWVYGSEDVRGRFLTALGFKLPTDLDEITGAEFGGNLSLERADLLDVDVIIWLDPEDAEGPLGGPVYQNLKVHTEGREVFLSSYDDPLGGATSFVSVLSLPFLLDGLVPQLAEALDKSSASLACEDGFRLFDHDLLMTDPICIPEAPERVLPLDMTALELMLITKQTPLGTAQWILDELPILLPEYAEALAPLPGLGYPAELEQVTALHPDLILAPADTIDVELAGQIAPVIVPDPIIYEDWKIGMQFWSEVLNQQDLYADMETRYNQRVAELQAALGQPEALEVSVISASTYGIWLWMPDSSAGDILTDVGLSRPEGQSLVGDAAIARYGEKQYIEISEERLDLVDGDAIFYFTYAALDPDIAAQESDFITTFNEKPLWQALGAVKAGKAFFVGGYWWRCQTYLLANKVLDDLFTHLTDTSATTPVLAGQE